MLDFPFALEIQTHGKSFTVGVISLSSRRGAVLEGLRGAGKSSWTCIKTVLMLNTTNSVWIKRKKDVNMHLMQNFMDGPNLIYCKLCKYLGKACKVCK